MPPFFFILRMRCTLARQDAKKQVSLGKKLDLVVERKGIEKKFYDLCLEVVSKEGLTLYDMDYNRGSSVLRVFVMDPQSQTAQLDDCVRVDRALTPFIEEEDWMPEELTLEVSSPGIDRVLKTKEHFELAVGQQVEISLFKKLSDITSANLPKRLGSQRKVSGALLELSDEYLKMKNNEDLFEVKFEDIKKANIEPQWEKAL